MTAGDGSHVLRLEATLDYLDGDAGGLLESYDALPVSQASVDDARGAATELIDRVEAHLAS